MDTESLMSRIAEGLPSFANREGFLQALAVIEQSNQQLFCTVAQSYLAAENDERSVWRCMFLFGGPPDEKLVRKMLEVSQLAVVLYPNSPPGYRATKVFELAQDAEQMHPFPPGYASYGKVKAAMILSGVGHEFTDPWERQALIHYISRNIDDVISVTPELMKRRNASIELIENLLSNESPALNDGVL